MKTLFCDLDGVLSDFDGQVFKLFGATPAALGDERMWPLVNNSPRFWRDMPLRGDAMMLWNAIREYDPVILTGCPRSGYDTAAAHKRLWIEQHLGQVPVITCLSKHKSDHMRRLRDVLIDDNAANNRRWRNAGGIAVLHTSAAETIPLVHDLMAQDDPLAGGRP